MSAAHSPPVIARDLALAAGMAFLAGATDVYGLGELGHLFVSFMSGNTTKMAVALGHQRWHEAGHIGILIGLFVIGAAAGEILGLLGKQHHAAVVAFSVALLLSLPLLLPQWTVPALLLAMGALNASMTRIGQFSISLTYVTGALIKFGQSLGSFCLGRRNSWSGLLQLPLWLSLLAGAIAASVARGYLGEPSIWPLPALALLLAVAAWGRQAQSDPAKDWSSPR